MDERIKEIEATWHDSIDCFKRGIQVAERTTWKDVGHVDYLLTRIRELEEGIEKVRKFPPRFGPTHAIVLHELYAILDKTRKEGR